MTSTYRPNRRDPLTQRFARSVADTRSDPYAYSESPSEPQLVIVDDPSDHAVDRLLRRWGLPVILLIVVLCWAGAL
jgi:hypothetical protein